MRAQEYTPLDLLNLTLQEAKTPQEKQAAAAVFLIWHPELAYEKTYQGENVSDLAQRQDKDLFIWRDGTPEQLYFAEIKARMEPDIQSAIDQLATERLLALNKVISDTHFEVHYTTDSGDHDQTTQAYADKVLDYLGKSYDTEITSWGYKAGASQNQPKYQVSIEDLRGAYGETRGFIDNPVTDPAAVRTFTTIGIAPNVHDDSLLLSSIAHEYHHASELAYIDFSGFRLWVLESSTAWLEYQVRLQYPAVVGNDCWNLLKQRMEWFQNHPSDGLTKTGSGVTDDYDAAIYWWFLVNNTKTGDLSGTGTPRQLNRIFWEKLAQKADWSKIYEAFDDTLVKADYETMDKAFAHFATAAALPDEWLPTGGEAIKHADRENIYTDIIFAMSSKKTYTAQVNHEYGIRYYQVNPGLRQYDLTVEFDGEDATNFVVKLITLQNGTSTDEETIPLDGARKGTSSTWSLNPDNEESGIIAVIRTAPGGNGSYDLTLKAVRNFAFVIDDTGSMWDNIDAVKQTALDKIEQMASTDDDWNWTLITFKDYVTVIGSTSQSSTIKGWINSLSASAGGDCPEESLGALRTLATAAPRSEAWLYTDASPHGGPQLLAQTILDLLRANIRVHPFILDWCYWTMSSDGGTERLVCEPPPGQVDPSNEPISPTLQSNPIPSPLQPTQTPVVNQPSDAIPSHEQPAAPLTQEELAQKAWEAAGKPQSSLVVRTVPSPSSLRPDADGTDLGIYLYSYYSELIRGETSEYDFYAYNYSGIPADQAVITMTLPDGVDYLGYWVEYPEMVGAGITPIISGNNVIWQLGTVPDPSYYDWYQYFHVQVQVRSDAPLGSATTTVSIATPDSEYDYSYNTTSVAQTIVEPTYDLYAYKYLYSPGSGSLIPGTDMSYYLEVGNYGSGTARNVRITDTLPAGTVFITATNLTNLNVSSGTLVWDVGDLGGYQYFYTFVTVHIPEDLPVGSDLVNRLEAYTTSPEMGYYSNEYETYHQVVPPSRDIIVYKYLASPYDPLDVNPGSQLVYHLQVYNYGNINANQVHITDTLPAEVEFISASNTISFTQTGNVLTWEYGSISPGSGLDMDVTVRVLTDTLVNTVLTNQLEASSAELDSNPSNNIVVDMHTVYLPTYDLSIYIYPSYNYVLPGENITYTIFYYNYASFTAPDVHITNTLMNGMAYAGASVTPSLVQAGQVIWDLGDLPQGSYGPIYLYTRQAPALPLGSVVTDSVTINGSGAQDRYIWNNSDNTTVVVNEYDGLLVGGEPYAKIAEETGGSYFEMLGAGYIELAQGADIVFTEMSSDANLGHQSVTVTDTQTHSYTFSLNVDATIDQLNVLLNGHPGSNLTMQFYGPDDVPVTGLLSSDEIVTHTVVANSAYYQVSHPMSGTWQAMVQGTGSFIFSSSANTPISLLYLGDTTLVNGAETTAKAQLTGAVLAADFSLVAANGDLLQNVTLYDDGLHGDDAPGDYVYAGRWTPTTAETHYLKVHGLNAAGDTYERIDPHPIKIQNFGLSGPEGSTILPGERITYTVTINNKTSSGESFLMSYQDQQGWAELNAAPGSVFVTAGGAVEIQIPVQSPPDSTSGDIDQLVISAIGQSHTALGDSLSIYTRVGTTIDLIAGLYINRTESPTPPCTTLPCPGNKSQAGDILPIQAGTTLTYTIVYTNEGSSPATGLVITATLPAPLVFLADDSGVPLEQLTQDTWQWHLPELAAYNKNSFHVWAKIPCDAPQEETLTSRIRVDTNAIEVSKDNNLAQASFVVRGIAAAPMSLIIYETAPGLPQIPVTLTAAVNLPATLPITYLWQAYAQPSLLITDSGISSTVTFTWAAPGTKPITVTASNAFGWVTENYNVTIYTPVQADFSATPTAGVAPLNVAFTNLSSGDYATCAWAFGDGGTSTACANPSHSFTAPGVYSVTLTVSGHGGADTETKTSYITAYTPAHADFSAAPLSGVAPLNVAFTNLSSGDYATCTWVFGDGGTSTICANPSHSFTAPGVYTVTLTVSGLGGEDTETKTSCITVQSSNYEIYLPMVVKNHASGGQVGSPTFGSVDLEMADREPSALPVSQDRAALWLGLVSVLELLWRWEG